MNKIIEPSPEDIFEQADRLFTDGKTGEAATLFNRLVDIQPWAAEANNRLGVIAGFQDRLEESRVLLEKAVAAAPGRIDIRQNLLYTLERLGITDLALELLLDIGAIQYIGKDYRAAIESFGRGLDFRPGWPRAWVNLMSALEADGQYATAIQVALPNLLKAVEGYPDQSDWLRDFIDYFAADFQHSKISTSDYVPDKTNRASAFNTLGNLARNGGATELARRAYEIAVRLSPEVAMFHQNLGQTQLSAANYAQGWANYEARVGVFESVPTRDFAQPLWRDQPLAGKTLLLWAEQGFGDTLQMLRFIPDIAARGGHVVVEVQIELVRLVSDFFGAPNVEVIPRLIWKDRILGNRPFDFHCPFMSLPHRLAVEQNNISGKPYLHVPTIAQERWCGWLRETPETDKLRIGLAWAGRPTHSRDRVRTLALKQLIPLLQQPGIGWVSLQVGAAREQLASLPGDIDIVDLTDNLRDFSETAALISQLDAIVSVDTSVVHVAGALGVPTAVILPAVPDWRWMFDRSDSPWYDSLTLFRRTDDQGLPDSLLDQIGHWLSSKVVRERG